MVRDCLTYDVHQGWPELMVGVREGGELVISLHQDEYLRIPLIANLKSRLKVVVSRLPKLL